MSLESLIVEKERYLKEAPCFLVNATFHQISLTIIPEKVQTLGLFQPTNARNLWLF